MSTYDGNKAVSMTQAYDIPPYVLHHVLRGQNWPDGDSGFYRGISVPVLLLHGLKDPLVTLVEMCEMERVSFLSSTLSQIHLAFSFSVAFDRWNRHMELIILARFNHRL
jgi:hypothetical protein